MNLNQYSSIPCTPLHTLPSLPYLDIRQLIIQVKVLAGRNPSRGTILDKCWRDKTQRLLQRRLPAFGGTWVGMKVSKLLMDGSEGRSEQNCRLRGVGSNVGISQNRITFHLRDEEGGRLFAVGRRSIQESRGYGTACRTCQRSICYCFS